MGLTQYYTATSPTWRGRAHAELGRGRPRQKWMRGEWGELRAASWVGFHSFRHTCATILFRRGWNPVQVQRWLGVDRCAPGVAAGLPWPASKSGVYQSSTSYSRRCKRGLGNELFSHASEAYARRCG